MYKNKHTNKILTDSEYVQLILKESLEEYDNFDITQYDDLLDTMQYYIESDQDFKYINQN